MLVPVKAIAGWTASGIAPCCWMRRFESLLAKEAAGANLALTQLFFHAEEYLNFVVLAREAGVTMRILPGIMPVVSPARLKRMIQLTERSEERRVGKECRSRWS